MPRPWLLIFELVLYGLLLLSLRHAWNDSRWLGVWRLAAGVGFGLLLEWATIQQLHAYRYGHFLIMFGDVPLAVGVGWGVIIYSARLLSDAMRLPPFLRPIMDGLLALDIDLAMDAIAIRLGMWEWGIDPTAEYFGVPYANFWAWFWVVTSFSAGYRILTFRGDTRSRWLAPAAGVGLGAVVVLSTNQLIVSYVPHSLYAVTVFGVIGSALALVLAVRPQVDWGGAPKLAAIVPLTFHSFFLAAGALSGIFSEVPFLLLVSLIMGGITLTLHRPWRGAPTGT
jgi:hypothetical protein